MALGTPTLLTSQSGSATSITTPSVTPTSGAAIVIIVMSGGAEGSADTLSMTGFTSPPTFTTLTNHPGVSAGCSAFYAIWTGSGSGTFTFTTGAGITTELAMQVIQVTGATGFGKTLSGSGGSVASVACSWSAATSGNDDALIVGTCAKNASLTAITINTPTSYTSFGTITHNNTSNNLVALAGAYKLNAADTSDTVSTTASVSALLGVGVEVLGPAIVNQALSATQARTATITRSLVHALAMSATQARTATIAMAKTLGKTLSATQARTATITRSLILGRTLAATQARTATIAMAVTRYGSWTKTYALTGITSVVSSAISWAQTTPGGSTVTVQASLDGETTWATCTSGNPVPGLTPGASVAPGTSLTIRVGLTKPDGGASPTFNNYALAIQGAAGSELLPLGTYAFEAKLTDSGGKRAIAITGTDRSGLISRATLRVPYAVSAGTFIHDAIRGLLDAAWSAQYPTWAALNYGAMQALSYTMPALVVNQGADAWSTAMSWAEATGAELYVTVTDQIALVPVADPRAKTAVWSYAEGSGCQMTQVERALTTTEPNDWVRDASGPGVLAARGQSYDDNPRSRSFVGGTYGDVQDYQQSTLITSAGQAQAAAQGARNRGLHAADAATVSIAPNPVLLEDDAVTVVRAAAGFAATDLVVIDALSLPLDPDPVESLAGRRITT